MTRRILLSFVLVGAMGGCRQRLAQSPPVARAAPVGEAEKAPTEKPAAAHHEEGRMGKGVDTSEVFGVAGETTHVAPKRGAKRDALDDLLSSPPDKPTGKILGEGRHMAKMLAETSDPLGGLPGLGDEGGRGYGGGMAHAVVAPATVSGSGTLGLRGRMGVVAPRTGSGGGGGASNGDGIRAGEWDDNANYREFQKYLNGASQLGHFVDVRDRRTIVVRDSDGKAVPGCAVHVADARQRVVTLTTSPAGRVSLFPRAENLTGSLTASSDCLGASAQARVEATDELTKLDLAAQRAIGTRTIDVAFILDTTGSMNEEIAAVKQTLRTVARGLGQSGVQVRVGMVEYKDRGDTFVTRVRPFTTDVPAFARAIDGLFAAGGGDSPESVNEAVHVAVSKLDWSSGSVGRFAFLIGDAPPHLDYDQDFDYAKDMKTAAHRGIQIFTVAASGMDDVGQLVWRQLAQYTGGTELFILRGGAGPQSVGGGDPKSSCGGRQKNYTSGHLDDLLLGIITRQVQSIDGNPLKVPGLKHDETAEPCLGVAAR
jgi:Mg-chelatase subunit ChlD